MENETITFENNPNFKLEFESKSLEHQGKPLKFYTPANITNGYHLSRYIAATAQNIYSSCGITPEILKAILDKITDSINKNKLDEVAVYTNNLKYRLSYPVDENAALRMALIFSFVDGEDPNKCEAHWTQYKLNKVIEDPEAYTFFLSKGVINTPVYSEYLQEISPSSLEQRKQALTSLIPTQ
jgi:F0F1-type ATP synthase gamma subunit